MAALKGLAAKPGFGPVGMGGKSEPIAWKESSAQMNRPGLFLVERPCDAGARRKVIKTAGRGFELVTETVVDGEV